MDSYQYPSPSKPPLLFNQTNVPLHNIRLPPLFDNDEDGPIPPEPFLEDSRGLHILLQQGPWRPLPYPSEFDLSIGRPVTERDVLHSATFLPNNRLVVILDLPDRMAQHQYHVQKEGQGFISVYDVINVVRRIIWTAERQPLELLGGYYHYGKSLRRASDGTWFWKGLSGGEQADMLML